MRETPAVHIVGVAIAVVIVAVAGRFVGVGPHDLGEVFVFKVDTRIDYCDDDTIGVGLNLPRLFHADVDAGNAIDWLIAAAVAGVRVSVITKSPQIVPQGIIGCVRVECVDRMRVEHTFGPSSGYI